MSHHTVRTLEYTCHDEHVSSYTIYQKPISHGFLDIRVRSQGVNHFLIILG